MRWLVWGLGCFLIVWMVWNLIWSDHGYLVYHKEKQQFETLKAEVANLRRQREKLAKEVLRLRHDPKALEEYVHRELGYVHPDEFMVIMPDSKGNARDREHRAYGEK